MSRRQARQGRQTCKNQYIDLPARTDTVEWNGMNEWMEREGGKDRSQGEEEGEGG